MATRERDTTESTTISFKSAGEKIEEFLAKETAVQTSRDRPIGIKTPLQLGQGDLFVTHTRLSDQITDNLRNLILTNAGERLGNPAFGANLRSVQFGTANKEQAEIEIMAKIQDAVRKFMPFVSLVDFQTTQLPESMIANSNSPTAGYPGGALLIRITYTVPDARLGEQALQLILPMGV